MTTTMCIGLETACILTLPWVKLRLRTCLLGLPEVASLSECASRSVAARTLSGSLLGLLILLFIPADSWAGSVPGYFSATSADSARVVLGTHPQLTDASGFGLKMDASLPASGKYGHLALTPTGLKFAAGSAWQAWFAAAALLTAGASLALRRRGRRERVELFRQPLLNTPPDDEGGQVWQFEVVPENSAGDSSVPMIPPPSVLATAQPAPVQAAAVSIAPRTALTIVERAMQRSGSAV